MVYYRVISQKIVSPDGKTIAEAKSTVVTSESDRSNTSQSVAVNVTGGNFASSYAKSSSRSCSS